MKRQFKFDDRVRHFKGGTYRIITLAKNSETGENLMLYKSEEDGVVYARELGMFCSKVDKEKYPEATQEYRFEPIKEGE